MSLWDRLRELLGMKSQAEVMGEAAKKAYGKSPPRPANSGGYAPTPPGYDPGHTTDNLVLWSLLAQSGTISDPPLPSESAGVLPLVPPAPPEPERTWGSGGAGADWGSPPPPPEPPPPPPPPAAYDSYDSGSSSSFDSGGGGGGDW